MARGGAQSLLSSLQKQVGGLQAWKGWGLAPGEGSTAAGGSEWRVGASTGMQEAGGGTDLDGCERARRWQHAAAPRPPLLP